MHLYVPCVLEWVSMESRTDQLRFDASFEVGTVVPAIPEHHGMKSRPLLHEHNVIVTKGWFKSGSKLYFRCSTNVELGWILLHGSGKTGITP